MYSFSSFLSNFRNFGQAKSEVADAKEESSTKTKESSSYQQNTSFLARRNHAGPGTGDKFGRYQGDEYQNQVTQNGRKEYSNSFVNPVLTRPPTAVASYTDKLMSGPVDYTKTKAWQRANKGYSTGSIFSSGVARLGTLSSLFDSVMNDPMAYSRNQNYGASHWS